MKGYITLQEAADLLGVSRPTMYRRALAAEQGVNSREQGMNSDEQPVNSKPASIVHDKKRYVSIDWALAEMDAAEPVNSAEQAVNSKMNSREQPVNSAEQPVNSTLNSNADRIRQLEKDLLAAQGEVTALQATVTAQEAHIDSLKTALDREQALHMASLQQRLPADTRDTPAGRSFMNWLKGWGKK